MQPKAVHPIIYVRGYAMSPSEIEDTVADPYMGFNVGSCKVRQLWDGKVKKYFFESPIVRLMKPPYSYDDVYEDGIDQVADDAAASDVVAYRSIVIYRYYEPSTEDLGNGLKPDMKRFAKGLSDLIIRLKKRMYPKGRAITPEEIAAGKPVSPDDFRVHLVAHSMGGLVCRAFLQNPDLDKANAREMVDKVFTYATPHNGIDILGIGNVPEWLTLYGINTFNRDEIAKLLNLKKRDRGDKGEVNFVTGFDPSRIFNLVGTNPGDYKAARGISSLAVGDASDGLVRIDNATTRSWSQNRIVNSPQAFVHRSHSGYYGIVNSEEGFQNLVRFLYGDIRADGWLDIDELTLPPILQARYEDGDEVRASYLFEVVVSVRGKQWQLHRRLVNEHSAIFRKYDDLFPKTGSKKNSPRNPDREQSPLLFNVFLDRDQRADTARKSLAFAVDLCIRVPEYTIDGFLFLKDHFEGAYLFRDLLTIEAIYEDQDSWKIEYRFANQGNTPNPGVITEDTDDVLSIEIPIEQAKPPGVKARLRIETRLWNR